MPYAVESITMSNVDRVRRDEMASPGGREVRGSSVASRGHPATSAEARYETDAYTALPARAPYLLTAQGCLVDSIPSSAATSHISWAARTTSSTVGEPVPRRSRSHIARLVPGAPELEQGGTLHDETVGVTRGAMPVEESLDRELGEQELKLDAPLPPELAEPPPHHAGEAPRPSSGLTPAPRDRGASPAPRGQPGRSAKELPAPSAEPRGTPSGPRPPRPFRSCGGT